MKRLTQHKIQILVMTGVLAMPSYLSAVTLTGADLSPVNLENRSSIAEDKKQRLIKETVEGTVMRTGVVYPIHMPIPDEDIARQFLAEGRPAASAAEMRELMTGLATGDPRALANFREHMDTYLMDPTKGPQLVNALNRAIDNPNAYKADPTFAQGVLREAFDRFLSLNGDERPETDFSRVDLDGFIIAGADLRKTGLRGDKLDYFTDWTGTNASGLDISEVNWQNKTIIDSIFAGSTLTDADFRNMNIAGTSFANAKLNNAKFSGAENAGSANFSGARASGANFSGTNAVGGNFRGATLDDADLSDADFSGADLRDASIVEWLVNELTKFDNAMWGNNNTECRREI
jgi:uncharacterized protein YjbI with pentapeptide repeats